MRGWVGLRGVRHLQSIINVWTQLTPTTPRGWGLGNGWGWGNGWVSECEDLQGVNFLCTYIYRLCLLFLNLYLQYFKKNDRISYYGRKGHEIYEIPNSLFTQLKAGEVCCLLPNRLSRCWTFRKMTFSKTSFILTGDLPSLISPMD